MNSSLVVLHSLVLLSRLSLHLLDHFVRKLQLRIINVFTIGGVFKIFRHCFAFLSVVLFRRKPRRAFHQQKSLYFFLSSFQCSSSYRSIWICIDYECPERVGALLLDESAAFGLLRDATTLFRPTASVWKAALFVVCNSGANGSSGKPNSGNRERAEYSSTNPADSVFVTDKSLSTRIIGCYDGTTEEGCAS